MSLKLTPFTPNDVDAAVALFARRYTLQRMQVPALPTRYKEAATLQPLLREIAEAGSGVVVRRADRVAGYMLAWRTPEFRGAPAVFVPEWAVAAEGEHRREIYEAMYAHLAAQWVAAGYRTHLISTLACDEVAVTTWHWLGFGFIAADAVRRLDPAGGARDRPGFEIRQAGPADLDGVMALERALADHLTGSPIFLPVTPDGTPDAREVTMAWLEDDARAVWLALQDGAPVAYLRNQPASDDACTIIVDDGTTSITGAYTRPDVRGLGVATVLLNRALAWARDRSYVRCAVDFEPMNPPAARFWLRHFAPVAYSLARDVRS